MKPTRIVAAGVVGTVAMLGLTGVGPSQANSGAPSGATVAATATDGPQVSGAARLLPSHNPYKYWICIPGVDAPSPNLNYPYSFALSTRIAHTHNHHIRRSVREIQAVLRNEIGINPNLAVDGVYGQQTKRAVKKFQNRKHLPVTGKVGARTWKKLARNCWKFH